MTDELLAFEWENQTDDELLNETPEGEPEATSLELAARMDSIFGPEPSMTLQPDPRRKIVNPLIGEMKTRSAFDLASEYSVEDLTAFRDLNGDANLNGGDAKDLAKMSAWTKADLAVSIATRLATRATAPTPDELAEAMSPVSEALIDLSDKQFERLVSDTLAGGGGGYGQDPELKKLRRMMKEQEES